MDPMALDEGGTAASEGVLRERGANLQQQQDEEQQLDRGLAKRARTGAGNAREEWIELVSWCGVVVAVWGFRKRPRGARGAA